jgi:NAD(P)H-nitrite reductase large subunit
MPRRHVLIGCGPAAIAAAETIRAFEPATVITMVDTEGHGYYSRPGLAYYLAKEVPEERLFPFSRARLERLDLEVVHDRAVRLDPAAHRVVLASGRELAYDRLLLATGSRAVPIGAPGEQLDGVTKLDDLNDARDLIRRSAGAKAAVVVGGGITAIEIVEGLRARHVAVHYFMRKQRYWSNVLSETESRVVEEGLRASGVQVHNFTRLTEIVGRDGHVAAVATDDGKQIPCDLVAVALGVMPQIGLAAEAGLACKSGVLVDPYLRCSDLDIFAAGDLAEVRDPVADKGVIEVLWNSAVNKGRIAGRNMATEPVNPYQSDPPLNVTRLAGAKITIMGTVGSGRDSDQEGVARGGSETWRRLGDAPVVESQLDDARVRLALGEREIAGAVVMGDQALSFPLQRLIAATADVSPIMADLQEPGAPLAKLIGEFWQSWEAHLV